MDCFFLALYFLMFAIMQSVLDGYNGTVMAYGQTGTGKTFTLGRLGEEDTADRGIMVRSMEDILANVSPDTDSICVSYLQVAIIWIVSLCNLFILLYFPKCSLFILLCEIIILSNLSNSLQIMFSYTWSTYRIFLILQMIIFPLWKIQKLGMCHYLGQPL